MMSPVVGSDADVSQKELHEAESKLGPYWEKTKDVVLRPATLGGLVGVGEPILTPNCRGGFR